MEEYYTSYDNALLADKVVTHLAFLTMNWRNELGRPTLSLVTTKNHLGKLYFNAIIIVISFYLK